MAARFQRLQVDVCHIGSDGTALALACARNIHAVIDRRAPEAGALATWLGQSANAFSLPDSVLPSDGDHLARSRGRGVSLPDWRKIASALDQASSKPVGRSDAPVEEWIAAISAALELDPLAMRIFAFVVLYYLDQRLHRLFGAISECRGGGHHLQRDASLLALLLGEHPGDVAVHLTPDAKLLGSGLLHIDSDSEICVLRQLLSLIRQDIMPSVDFYGQLLGSIDTDPLPWESFAHLGRQAAVAVALLKAALSGKERGVNILLYGPPGTGKTSFAATLAAHIGARIRPVCEADESGGEPSRHERLAGLRLAQRLATSGETVLLFDEAEDLFVHRGPIFDQHALATSRVFIHRLLERSAVPVIWTANDIGVLGPAVLRRMTMCMELKVPNLATRKALWRRMGEAEGIVLQEADAGRLARLVPAAPAVASAAMRATRLAGGGAETARLIVEGVARAIRGGELPAPDQEQDAAYDIGLVNADHDLTKLTDDLLRCGTPRAVSFLLSGPPGAGKSAWVRHLAGRLGMPVLQKRASDLLNSFVGGTEQNIAGAFAEAREAQAFLVFDEADSLLLERADAVRSWEISQVNEMLTWMEGHELPFACTTNLADRLDRASLRRFLIKLRFDWLTAAQARHAFRKFFGLSVPAGLDALRTLTPADFALVSRRVVVHGGASTPAKVLRLLADECDGRIAPRVPVGFARSMAAE